MSTATVTAIPAQAPARQSTQPKRTRRSRQQSEEVARFFEGLRALEEFLASAEPLGNTPEKIFQGPIADALTHVGQLAMLRRMAGAPVRGENYFLAEIVAGRVGVEQAAPRKEFD